MFIPYIVLKYVFLVLLSLHLALYFYNVTVKSVWLGGTIVKLAYCIYLHLNEPLIYLIFLLFFSRVKTKKNN